MTRGALVLALALAACDTGPTSDPRCDDLCDVPRPDPAIGYACSVESNDTCNRLCEQRIEGADNLCAECLLEYARYGPPQTPWRDEPVECSIGQCWVIGFDDVCYYPEGDAAARRACELSVRAVRYVSCSPGFESVSACSGVCQ